MAVEVQTRLRLILKFAEHTFSFKDIDFMASDAELYELAGILNKFMDEKPPEAITVENTFQIL